MDIEWEDPPAVALARVKTPGKYVEWAYALREHPERWAKLPDDGGERTEKGAQNLAQNIRRGATAGFSPKGTYEAVADAGQVWVRYAPPAEKDAPEQGDDTPAAERPARRADTATVRQWARTQGFNVTDRGRISDEIYDAYEAAKSRGLRAVDD